jgi:peptide/nickel transport system substrate-binding protein
VISASRFQEKGDEPVVQVESLVERIVGVFLGVTFGVFLNVASFAGEAPVFGGTLRLGSQRDLSTLNPFMRTVAFDHNLRSLIYEPLTMEREGTFASGLAESWEISKDGKEYTFHLRKGVIFHNGKSMTSEDVRWSLEHAMDPKSRAHGRGNLPEIQAVEASEPSKVRIRLKEPFVPFIPILTTIQTFPVVPSGSLQPGEQQGSFPPGTGPYRFDGWLPGSRITLRKHPNYWQKGIPYIDAIVSRHLPDAEVRFAALRSGDIDVAERVSNHHVDAIGKGKHKGLQIALAEGASMKGVAFNVAAAPFDDVRIRQAFAYAIDKEEIIRAVYWGFGTPVNQKNHPSSPWYFDVPDRKRDIEKARAILKEAGYPIGLKVKALAYLGTEEDLLMIQKQLKEVGVEIDIQSVPIATFLEMLRKKEFTFGAYGGDSYPDPDPNYYTTYHSRRNNVQYSNANVDTLLERGRVTMDLQERKKIYREIVRIVNDEAPVIWYAIGPYAFVSHSYVRGFKTNSEGRYFSGDAGFPFAWIKK